MIPISRRTCLLRFCMKGNFSYILEGKVEAAKPASTGHIKEKGLIIL